MGNNIVCLAKKNQMKWNLLLCGTACACFCCVRYMAAKRWADGRMWLSSVRSRLTHQTSRAGCYQATVPLPSVGAVSVKHGPNHCVTVKVSNSISAVGLWLSADFNYHASASISDQKQTGNCSVMSYELEKQRRDKKSVHELASDAFSLNKNAFKNPYQIGQSQ